MRVRPTLTVVTPAASRALVALAVAKDEMNITGSAQDARLTRWISDASGLIDLYLNRTLAQETVTETWDQRGAPRSNDYVQPIYDFGRDGLPLYEIRLSRYPVASVASVVLNDGTPLDPALDYIVYADEGMIRSSLLQGGKVAVSYTGGYLLPDGAPGPLAQACLALVVMRQSMRGRDPTLRSVSVPGVLDESYWVGTRGDNGALPPEVLGLIDAYREYPA